MLFSLVKQNMQTQGRIMREKVVSGCHVRHVKAVVHAKTLLIALNV